MRRKQSRELTSYEQRFGNTKGAATRNLMLFGGANRVTTNEQRKLTDATFLGSHKF